MTTFSIALATYNGATFLREQLDSLARQTRLPDELVVSDDGSTDGTLEIVQDFASNAPFEVIVLPSEGRLGYKKNFMRCAARCAGDLIAFCDQDDVWDRDKLAVISGSIEPDALLLQHDFRVADSTLSPLPGSMDTTGLSLGGPWAPILGLVQVFRRSLLATWPLWQSSIDHNHPSEPMAHDQWVYFAAEALGKVQLLRRPLLTYRQHGRNTCGFSGNRVADHDLRPRRILADLMIGRSDTRVLKKQLIAKNLEGITAASERRLAAVSAMSDDPTWADHRMTLTRSRKAYEDLHTYYGYRLTNYEGAPRSKILTSVVSNGRHYLSQRSRGIKDLVLDVVLNVA